MKFKLPHPKVLLSFIALLFTLLVLTYWKLTPGSGGESPLTIADIVKPHVWKVQEHPAGNIFNENRELGGVAPEVDDEAKQENEPKEVSYRLLGIIRKGDEQQALFVGNGERIILSIGDELPNIGHLSAIQNNKVIIQDKTGTEQEWLLFPTGNTQNVKDKEKS